MGAGKGKKRRVAAKVQKSSTINHVLKAKLDDLFVPLDNEAQLEKVDVLELVGPVIGTFRKQKRIPLMMQTDADDFHRIYGNIRQTNYRPKGGHSFSEVAKRIDELTEKFWQVSEVETYLSGKTDGSSYLVKWNDYGIEIIAFDQQNKVGVRGGLSPYSSAAWEWEIFTQNRDKFVFKEKVTDRSIEQSLPKFVGNLKADLQREIPQGQRRSVTGKKLLDRIEEAHAPVKESSLA